MPESTNGLYSLIPYKPRFTDDLVRVGRPSDGGYVINDLAVQQTKYLLSFGVNDEWSFEVDFLRRNPTVKILCFDHSVSKDVFKDRIIDSLNQILSLRFVLGLFSLNFRGARNKVQVLINAAKVHSAFGRFFGQPNVEFISKGVSNETTDSFLKLEDVFRLIPASKLAPDSVFIKMDIEQSEFRVLPDFSKFREYLIGFVVEFHDLDMLWTNFTDIMSQLLADFEITHLHGNNSCGLVPATTVPKLLEITFIKRTLLADPSHTADRRSYPIPGLDYPNDPKSEDFPLSFDF